ncbi:ras and EF-hand domain-containing protein homolog isoform X2 [Acanthaster planci]|uniref:Ras and EF-hand domain-containing protein homolog isoform X2 n=1 Tax=Acanthaster planci TaxID=133434 RepID=A0A8B7Z868_ACAPL|nr:ras and EF-hand domain-containing protein homolog isoform X2 [Acanthaster planci]
MAYEEGLSPDSIRRLFVACDLDGNGYIERHELAVVCHELDPDQLQKVFEALDRDGDGRISLVDFSAGFDSVGDTLLALSRRRRRQQLMNSAISEELEEFLGRLGSDFDLISSQEQVCELYQQLHAADLPQCLSQFENIICETIKDIKQQQSETDRLEKSLKRANDSHSSHLRHLETEMEAQVAKVEQRVRQEEQEAAQVEREELKRRMEAEITELQNNLSRFHSFEKRWQMREKPKDETLKKRLDELQHENRQLKSGLTESQTNLALARSELAAFKSEYDECLDSDKHLLNEYMFDHDSLARQVLQLQEANRRLQDTNDDLRASLESIKRSSRSLTPTKQKRLSMGSLDYYAEDSPVLMSSVTDASSGRRRRSFVSQDSMESEPSVAGSASSTKRRFVYHQTADGESYPDEVDSGNSTLRDPLELDSELEVNCVEDELRRATSVEENAIKEAILVGGQKQAANQGKPHRVESITDSVTAFQKGDVTVATSSSAQEPMAAQKNEKLQRNLTPRNSGRKRELPQVPLKTQPTRPQTAPERMYKIVLAGDAAVGKSSFILRLCKGVFQNNLNSTLGVDFQMKTLEIDDKVTSLQLWDTAGQERFRSIAKSYFRRADGVLLLYDCTYERSFINVRDWIEAIEDGAQKPIPVMICANKVDARSSAQAEGIRCVRMEDGQRLARSFSALFIECSAKDGTNIEEAVADLTRKLQQREDQEVSQSGLSLEKDAQKKSDSKCCM